MTELNFPAGFKPVRGKWTVTGDIRVANIQKRDIYRAPSLTTSVCKWEIPVTKSYT